ncbi:unnamed protein product [Rhizoctonia solani]|uniref:Transmembrane protein n=1 Tax=Rhizoctonia solani TaxID=456999 RepID=A0A8H3I6T9_9AGAM|nr:unnamed protein product [Rhizoctonia solani]
MKLTFLNGTLVNCDLSVSWIFIPLNDLFILTIDFGWTNTYLGCIATQMLLNSCFVASAIGNNVLLSFIYLEGGSETIEPESFAKIALGASMLLVGLCSLCLLFINIWPIFVLRRRASIKNLLKMNNKDAFMPVGTMTPLTAKCALGVRGCSRNMTTPLSSLKVVFHYLWIRLPEPARRLLSALTQRIGRFFAHMLFRRISPVETKSYAFIRNGFAMGAVVALVFRTVTAILQAQNQFGTRMVSGDCDGYEKYHSIQILMERDPSPQIDITIWKSYTAASANASVSTTTTSCNLTVSQTLQGKFTTKVLDLYICERDEFSNSNISSASMTVGYPTLQVEARRRDGLEFSTASTVSSIWLVNALSTDYDIRDTPYWTFERDLIHTHPARSYLPGWGLLPGAHIKAEAKLITRRFIRSSLVKDIVLNSEPTYRTLSLYPIYEIPGGAFNYTNRNIATTRIQVLFKPGLMYFRGYTDLQNFNLDSTEICDFIDDYRLGTIFDVIGSVGGLFALLQAAHVLLFGRPLLWGLTGAKLISPFGLVGAWSSEGFKYRMRQQYHREASEGNSDTFLITPFLRDFVVDFGPVDTEPVHRQGTSTSGGN